MKIITSFGISTCIAMIAHYISPNIASAQVATPNTHTNSKTENSLTNGASAKSFFVNFFSQDPYYDGLFSYSATSITPNGECNVASSHLLHNELPFYTLEIGDSTGSIQNRPLVLTIPEYTDGNDIGAIGSIGPNETPEQAKQRCVAYLLKNSPTQSELNHIYENNMGTFTLQTLFPVRDRTNIENLNPSKTELQGLIYLGEYENVRYFALPTKLNEIDYIGKGPSGSAILNQEGKLVGLCTTFDFLFFGQKLLSDSIHNIYKNIHTLDVDAATKIVQKEKKSDRTLNYITIELLKEFSLKEMIKKRYKELDELDKYLKENPNSTKLVQDIIKFENQVYDVKIEIGKLLEKLIASKNLNDAAIDTIVEQIIDRLEKLIDIDIQYQNLFGATSRDGSVREFVKKLPGLPNPREFFSRNQLVGVGSITKENIEKLTIHPLSRNKSPLLDVLPKSRLNINKQSTSNNSINHRD